MKGNETNLYLCIKQFNSRLGDELNLKVGDKIEVLADDSEYNDGWYMGKNLSNNEVGLYPKTFTQLLANEPNDHPNLLRSRSRSRRLPSNSFSSSNQSSPNLNLPNPNPPANSNPPPASKISQLANTFENLSFKTNNNTNGLEKADSKNDQSVNKTMNDIDRALQELQSDSFENNSDVNVTDDSIAQLKSSNLHPSNGKSHQRSASNVSLTEDLNPKDAMKWTPKQVTSYFALGLGFDASIAGKFARHKITGAILFELDLAHLKELDIDSFGTRFEIHKEIENLKKIVDGHEEQKGTSELEQKGTIGLEPPHHPSQPQTPSSQMGRDSPDSYNPYAANNDSISSNPYGHARKRSQSMENLPDINSNLNKNFEFGDKSNVNTTSGPSNDIYKSRFGSTSVLAAPANPGQGVSRPASSVYDQSIHSRNHSRNISNTSDQVQPHLHQYGHARTHSRTHSRAHSRTQSGNVGHRRHSSIISQGNNERTETGAGDHKRHSSLFLFMSKGGDDIDTKKYYDKKQDKLISPAKIKHSNNELDHSPRNPVRTSNGSTPNGRGAETVDIDQVQFSPRKLKSINFKYDEPKKPDMKDDKRSISDSANLNDGSGGSNPSSNSTTPKNSTSISRFKTLRTASTNNFKNLTTSKKLKTSAFQEGIRHITPDEAIKTANYSGFMSKRSGNNLSWRSRYFTLHGTRLLYFTSLKDKKEKGLIDITAHKVIPINSEGEDKYVALYAASTGLGRYCFKLIPPAPGFKKGLTFTQPKTHYFAVETHEEMRGWLKALMTCTIDIDDSVPVVSSCSTPTVSLAKAQELLAKAREETKLKDEEIKSKGFLGDFSNFGGEDDFSEAQLTSFIGNYTLDPNSSGENSPIVESLEEGSNLSSNPYSISNVNTPNVGTGTSGTSSAAGFTMNNQHSSNSYDHGHASHLDSHGSNDNNHPKLSIDTSGKPSSRGPTTPQASNNQGGFASPYLLASGLLSPRLNSGNLSPSIPPPSTEDEMVHTINSGTGTGSISNNSNAMNTNMTSNVSTPLEQAAEHEGQAREYFPEFESNETTPKLVFSGSNGRVSGGSNANTTAQSHTQTNGGQFNPIKKKRHSEKMLAYTSDGSGNHTFYIQPKKH